MGSTSSLLGVMAVTAALSGGCAPTEIPTPAAGPVEPRIGAPERAVDSRIMGVLDEGCQKLGAEAAEAKSRARDPGVIHLAQSVYDDCTSYLKNQRALGAMLGLTAAPSTVQARLEWDSPVVLEDVATQQDPSYERNFVERMISEQDEILGLADSTMARSANNPQLRALIDVQLTPSLQKNIAAAKVLQVRLRDDYRRERYGW